MPPILECLIRDILTLHLTDPHYTSTPIIKKYKINQWSLIIFESELNTFLAQQIVHRLSAGPSIVFDRFMQIIVIGRAQ